MTEFQQERAERIAYLRERGVDFSGIGEFTVGSTKRGQFRISHMAPLKDGHRKSIVDAGFEITGEYTISAITASYPCDTYIRDLRPDAG